MVRAMVLVSVAARLLGNPSDWESPPGLLRYRADNAKKQVGPVGGVCCLCRICRLRDLGHPESIRDLGRFCRLPADFRRRFRHHSSPFLLS